MLKPLTHIKRNVRELPSVRCGGSSHANCTEHERSEKEWSNAVIAAPKLTREYARSKCPRHMNLQTAIVNCHLPFPVGRSCVLTDQEESECVQELEVQAIYWLSRQNSKMN